MFCRLLLTVLLLAATLGPAQPAQADPLFPAGSRVGLEPAGDMKRAAGFAGLEDAERKVKVDILDLPRASYGQILDSTFASDQQGLRNVSRESFPYRSGIGYLISADTTEDGEAVRRFFLVGVPIAQSADDDLVGLVKVGVPEAARGVYSDEVIRKMLASMTFREVPVGEQVATLPFKMNDLGGYRVLRVVSAGAVILVDGAGSDLTQHPYMIISVGPGNAPAPEDRGRAARDLLSSAPLRDMAVQVAEPMRIGGAPGYEIRAQAMTPNGRPVTLVQWVRFGTSGFMRIIGVSPRGAWDRHFPRFRAVRDGIGPR